MPQLDFSTAASQLFWLAVSFTLLYLLLSRFCIPQFVSVIEARKAKIKEGIEEAENTNTKVQELEKIYSHTLQEAKVLAHKMIQQALEARDKEAAKESAALDKTLESNMKISEKHITELKKKAYDNIMEASKELARAAAEKITSVKLNKENAVNIANNPVDSPSKEGRNRKKA